MPRLSRCTRLLKSLYSCCVAVHQKLSVAHTLTCKRQSQQGPSHAVPCTQLVRACPPPLHATLKASTHLAKAVGGEGELRPGRTPAEVRDGQRDGRASERQSGGDETNQGAGEAQGGAGQRQSRSDNLAQGGGAAATSVASGRRSPWACACTHERSLSSLPSRQLPCCCQRVPHAPPPALC